MRQRYFITSTGTGIGKTFITAALVRQAKVLGKSIVAYKPVISGFDPARSEESDTGILLSSLGLPITTEAIERISPWRFKEPLAPAMAARLENPTLNFKDITAHSIRAINGPEDVVLIEGVGGVMVPLTDKQTICDWIEVLEIEAILVTGTYLGTLSHTLTALDTLQHRGIPVFAVIVNESEESTVPVDATVEELRRWTRLPLVMVKRRKSGRDVPELRALLS